MHEVLSPALNAHWNAKLLLSVQKRGDEAMRDVTSDAYTALHAVWDTTCKELEAGWCIGVPLSVGQGVEPNQKWVGFTFKQVQDHPWVEHAAQLRLIRRFAVFQKVRRRTGVSMTALRMGLTPLQAHPISYLSFERIPLCMSLGPSLESA